VVEVTCYGIIMNLMRRVWGLDSNWALAKTCQMHCHSDTSLVVCVEGMVRELKTPAFMKNEYILQW